MIGPFEEHKRSGETVLNPFGKKERPPIFDERNRFVWDAARRFMIFLLKELDKYYGWKTFEK